jgi:DNA (cytosine-5)-methyltransferase 1
MTFGSLFAGIEGFGLGFEQAGLECVWQVEIDPACQAVLRRHFPHVPKFLDVKDCGKHNLATVDVLCGGFPCQDLSVAGKGEGITGERSGLFYELTRITDELQPAYLVWENVPGLLSNRGGSSMLAVLIELQRIGYFGCWTTLDARWFGLAQRRRRVFGVFARSDIGAGRCAEILSLASRRPGYIATCQKEEQDVAATLRGRSHGIGVNRPGRGGEDDDNLIVGTLTASTHPGGLTGRDAENGVLVCGTLQGTDRGPSLQEARQNMFVTHSLTANGHDASEDGTGRGSPLAVVYQATGAGAERAGSPTMACSDKNGTNQLVASRRLVRRLTPIERERLQGFPDNWTAGFADSIRERMIGNAVPRPVAKWLGSRLMKYIR